jgi:peptidoglycan LD-endopeptidase LytH
MPEQRQCANREDPSNYGRKPLCRAPSVCPGAAKVCPGEALLASGRILKHRMKILARVLIVTVLVSAVAVVARPFAAQAWFLYTLAIQEPATALPEPLASRRSLKFVDSWGNPRGGGRSHEGIDIFASKDTPVLSTTNGIVTRVGTNNLGGQVIWILGPGLERHYYAHLNRYGTFRTGDRVNAGEIIGYAGNTGNARGGPVHLHYGIYRNGTPQNPYPRFAAGARGAVSRTAHARATTS